MEVKTGDQAADIVLKLILARVESLPRALRDDVRDAVSSIFFNWRYIAFQTKLPEDVARAAVDYLERHQYLRVDRGMYKHGVSVWLRCRLEYAA